MKPYFSNPDRCEALRREAATWVGTPFLPRGCNKGRGVDCISLCAMIYMALGLITVYRPPAYSMDGGSHLDESQLEREINYTERFSKVWTREGAGRVDVPALTMAGDLVVSKLGRVTHHTGIVLSGEELIHAVDGPGVYKAYLRDPALARKVHTIYRPLEA